MTCIPSLMQAWRTTSPLNLSSGLLSGAAICAVGGPRNAALQKVQSDAIAIVHQLLAIHHFPQYRGVIFQASHPGYISSLLRLIGNDTRAMSAYVIRIGHLRPVPGRIQHMRETHNNSDWQTLLHTTVNPIPEGHLAWPSCIADFRGAGWWVAANKWLNPPLRSFPVCIEFFPCQSGENPKAECGQSISTSPEGCATCLPKVAPRDD